MLALITFLVVIAVVLTAARVGAIALEATGMSEQSAEFQARSALLGVGFTTSEAENVTGHPTRRRIVLWLMTFGNAGTVTAIGSWYSPSAGPETVQTVQRSGILVAGTVALLASVHTSPADRLITAATQAGLRRFTELDTTDFHSLLRFDADYAVTELTAHDGEWLVGKSLADLHLTAEGVVVLGILRADGSFLGTPTRGEPDRPRRPRARLRSRPRPAGARDPRTLDRRCGPYGGRGGATSAAFADKTSSDRDHSARRCCGSGLWVRGGQHGGQEVTDAAVPGDLKEILRTTLGISKSP